MKLNFNFSKTDFSWKNVFATIGFCSLFFLLPVLAQVKRNQDARLAALYGAVESEKMYCELELARVVTKASKEKASQIRPAADKKKRGTKL